MQGWDREFEVGSLAVFRQFSKSFCNTFHKHKRCFGCRHQECLDRCSMSCKMADLEASVGVQILIGSQGLVQGLDREFASGTSAVFRQFLKSFCNLLQKCKSSFGCPHQESWD